MSERIGGEDGEESPTSASPGGPATTRSSLDIVIVNWNAGRYLRDCLRSVAGAQRSAFELLKVVVVDNASTDDSLEEIHDIPLPLHILRNAENRGFAAACNQGARAGDADLVLFLNPDTKVFPDTIDVSVSFMADPRNAHIGICGAQMVADDGAREFSCARFPTLTIFVAKMTGLARAFPRFEQRLPAEEVNQGGVVDQVIGAYFLIRRSLFEALDGFDERFFVYLEEVDLAYRARRLGYASYFLSHVAVYHAERVSSEQVRAQRLFYLLRSRTEYARKHWPAWQVPLLAALILTVELPARAVVASVRRRRDELSEIGKATWLYARYALGRESRRAVARAASS
jgi:N-acetylglucosaminyl-diphospho-decaprenol L-rhamnosyltransferase